MRYTLTDPGSAGLRDPAQCPLCGTCYDLAADPAARQAGHLAWRTPCCHSQPGPPVLVITDVPGGTGPDAVRDELGHAWNEGRLTGPPHRRPRPAPQRWRRPRSACW
jgi:hypothetical protein